jgi:hypothetical protein
MIRRSLTAALLLLAACIATPAFLKAYSSNPPTKRTSAPGESTCASCHGTLNDGAGTLTIAAPTTFMPGQTYSITVTLAHTGKLCWGFSMTALHKADNSMAGSFVNTTPLTGTQTSSGKIYVNQITSSSDGSYGGSAGPVNWTFHWVAPPDAAGADTVIFYASGVTADWSGDADSGDPVYTKTAMATEDAATPTLAETWGHVKARYR